MILIKFKIIFFQNLFYNEQCLFGDSGKIPSRKTRLKTKPGARAPNWPSLCAQAERPCHRPPACRAPRARCAPATRLRRACRAFACSPNVPLALACEPQRLPTHPLRAPRACYCLPRAPLVALLAQRRARRRVVACAATQSSSRLFQLSQYNFFCIAIQIFFPATFLPQYTRLYCDTVSASLASQPAIQTSVLQYKIFQPSLLYCNTM